MGARPATFGRWPRRVAVAAIALLASCHTWGFYREVEAPAPYQHTDTSGLSWTDVRAGQGDEVVVGSLVTVHYTGRFPDGTPFDSSLDRGKPFEFVVGRGQVIRGWDEGMLGMRTGGERHITIPPELGYGAEGREGVIPPDATLIVEVELLRVAAL